jgi:hypothetical protein
MTMVEMAVHWHSWLPGAFVDCPELEDPAQAVRIVAVSSDGNILPGVRVDVDWHIIHRVPVGAQYGC